MTISPLAESWYTLRFEVAFRDARGTAFQSFFNKLMAYAYRSDFIACRPWGSDGDKKNDGFKQSSKTLYQVYAPDAMSKKKAVQKITEDFEGAKLYWKKLFEEWFFVHNSLDGLPPHVIECIQGFRDANKGIVIKPFGFVEIKDIFRTLHYIDKEDWFGVAPSNETKTRLGFEDIRHVLSGIDISENPARESISAVPAGKIRANSLSKAVAELIRQGVSKAPLVEDFLSEWHDATLGERTATAFKREYARLRSNGLNPNEIFSSLQSWAGGYKRGVPEHELAVITVISYYFERCDIFEPARSQAK